MQMSGHSPGNLPKVAFSQRVLITVGITAAVLITLLIVWFARHVMLLVFAGIVVGVFLQWGKRAIMHYTGLPGLACLGILVLFLSLLLGGLLAFLVPVVIQQTVQLVQEIPDAIERVEAYLYRFGWGDLFDNQSGKAGEMLFGRNRDELMKSLKNIVGIFSTTFGTLFGIIVIVVIGIYIAADKGLYIRGILSLLPLRFRPRGMALLANLGHVLRWWLLGQSMSMLILGSTVATGLWVIGIPNAVVLAVFTAIMTFIPNLGPLIAFIPIALVAMAQGTLYLVPVGIFYVIIQSLEGFFLTPMIHRKVITMPPVLILATQVLLYKLTGFLGVLLAMPLVACAMVIVQMIYIEDFIGEKGPAQAR